ncbi:hypothetical protein K503DRAFT_237241 [Rhizopogon vinicolor AM-OR11-026]|uniref:Protein kinase domain-containing protein n=1 Tax=Rhizopogon vinicolor AM-OR11-026 TaxID=1314800 RepID=A0A1B7MXW2_9AGAM|nr:hypothetical protein K503DRAFT_237241 [Rhizopogon vinicolor AM-OR11-026]
MTKIGGRFDYLHLNEGRPGAWQWLAPELIPDIFNEDTSGERYAPSPPSDIYSYGCIIYEVLSGFIPSVPIKAFMQGETRERPKSKNMQDDDWIFILQCWLSLPSLRPLASQALIFFRTRRDHAESREKNHASIYWAHLDGANVYNLSSLVCSHPRPAFSDPAICWKSIDKLAKALIGLPTTGRYQNGLIDAIRLYLVSFTALRPMTSSLPIIFAAVTAQIDIEQSDTETLDAIERFGDDSPLHFIALSYYCLRGIADHMIKQNPHITPMVRHLYRKLFDNTTSDTLCRLQIALACARIFENTAADGFSLEAYDKTLQLLQLHVSATYMTAQWAEPVEHLLTSLAVDSAATALHLGDVNKAVELLEWGRELFRTYNVRSHADEKGEKQISEQPISGEQISEKHISEADSVPCQRLSFSDLLTATQDGPVIILIASRRSCDAIIVSKAHLQPLHIPLTIDLSSLVRLSTTFQACISPASEDSNSVEENLRNVLLCLWVHVVAPVIRHLSLENVPRNSRIWWCPTSIFSTLPVHAAGDYTSGGEQLSQHYVSSYTFSITSLLRARTYTNHPKSFSQFAAIYQAKPLQNDEQKEVEYPVIESAEVEPDILICNLPASLSLTRFADATKDDAKEAFEGHGWFHLLAYATENAYQPLNSSLLMRDGSLSIPDILRANPRPKEFAFLSTRPVGSRFNWMQKEIIQFTAGLQIAGFKSVVGTMGNVGDSDVIDKFYSNFFRTAPPDCTRAARALHDALEEMANSKAGLSLGQRIAFVHYGL